MTLLTEIGLLTPLLTCCLWFITIAFSFTKRSNWFKLPLLIFYADAIFSLLMSNFYYRKAYGLYVFGYVPAVFAAISMFPLYYIYIKQLVSEGGYPLGQRFMHLIIPAISMVSVAILIFGITPTPTRQQWIEALINGSHSNDSDFRYLNLMDKILRKLFLITSVVYFYLTNKEIQCYRSLVNQYFAYDDSTNLSWFKTLKYSYWLTIIAAFAYYTLGRHETSQTVVLPILSHLLLTVFFWNAGYHGHQQRRVFDSQNTLSKDSKNAAYETLGIGKKLTEQLVEKEVFRETQLTLGKLALLVGTNKSYLSRYINQELNTNFNDLINRHRITCAQRLLQTGHKNLYEICELSGFNSMSSFYRAFKKFTGYTPTETTHLSERGIR